MIQKAAVVDHHWLSASQLGAAIGIAQFTPGPILNVATFTGFMAAGFVGALAASFAIYAPSFVMTLFFAQAYERVRHFDWIRGAMAGVLAAFVGMLVMVLARLGEHALTGPFAVAVASLSFVALRYLKWSLPVIYLHVGVAVLGWSARSQFGG
jgi:chromate transporter